MSNTDTNTALSCDAVDLKARRIDWREALPRNPNGKYDRSRLAAELAGLFANKDG